jgi:cytoskeleton protein RodZ
MDPEGGAQASAVPESAVSTAEALAAARQRRGMGKGEVAQRLKLHPRQLDAIERGDWGALPGRAFVRGCVRAYGRLLDVDVAPLLASIGGFAEAEELKPTSALRAPLPRIGGGRFGFEAEGKTSRLWWAALGLGAVIVVGLFFGRDGDLGGAGSGVGQGAPPAPPVAAAGEPPGAPLVPPPLVPAPGPSAAPAAPGETVPGAHTAPAGPPPPSIRLAVNQDAWVDVRQADGKSIYMGTVRPGAPVELEGAAPYALIIGNASAVTLEYGGRQVDLRASITTPNNIAKVTLP